MRARWLVPLLVVLGCRKTQLEVKPDDQKSAPRVVCTLVEPIVEAKVPPRCDLAIDKLVKVPAGASLEIGAGARLTFAKGAGLVMEGGVLRARGTAEEPIVFTSATRVAGDFHGIAFTKRPFDRAPMFAKTDAGADAAAPPPYGESVLEHVVVEWAGGEQAAVQVQPFPGDKVSLFDVRIKNPKGHALLVDGAADVTRLEAIHTDQASVSLPLRHLGSLGADQTGAVHLHGAWSESVKLAKRERPYVIESSVGLDSTKAPLTFEIEKGSVLQFAKNARLAFNGKAATVTFVAKEVTFTSAEPKPAAGDWAGIVLWGDIAADIEGSTFEFAGSSATMSSGVLRLPVSDKKVRVVGSTFRDNRIAAFEAWSSCKPWNDPALKNTSVGHPLCEEMSFGAIGLLGSLGSTKPLAPIAFDSSSIGTLDVMGSSEGIGGFGNKGWGSGGGGGGIADLGGPAKPASKVVESSITASGGLPVEVVRRVVRTRVASLRACHSGSGTNGTISVAFTISDTGAVTAAKVSGGTLGDGSVRSCVTGVFQGMTFPSADGAGVTNATATHDYS